MDIVKEFVRYVAYLSQGLGHADRHAELSGYCTGLMLLLSHKGVKLPAFYQCQRNLFQKGLQRTRFKLLPGEGAHFQCVDISAVSGQRSTATALISAWCAFALPRKMRRCKQRLQCLQSL